MLKRKKVKAEIDEEGRVIFWKNDSDGFSEKDWMILISSIVFFGGISIGLILVSVGMFLDFELPNKYIELIESMGAPISVVLGGVFSVKGIETYVNRPSKKSEDKIANDEGSDI